MGMKITDKLVAVNGEYQLKDYEDTKVSFNWKEVEKEFSWSSTGKVNIAYEAIDRHADTFRKNKVALFFDDGVRKESYTFHAMKKLSNKAANVLKQNSSLKKGERLFIFMPRSPEMYFVLLGAIKMGVIAGPLFETFMEGAVYDRLADSEAKVLVTTATLLKRVPLEKLPHLEKVFIVGEPIEGKDQLLHFDQLFKEASESFEIEWVDLDDGMLLHYTFDSPGAPKGVLHVHNAMIQLYQSAKWVLDLGEKDIFWCTAEPGWIAGTSYGVFGPWLNGVTNLVVGGRFSPKNWYKAIENYGVTVWYSSPTAFRMLIGAGTNILKQYNLSSLRHILSVGEPLNPEVIRWVKEELGYRIHDTWWNTETGGQMICNYPSMDIKPGSIGKPLPGIYATVINDEGEELAPYSVGNVVIRKGWPAMMGRIWGNSEIYNSYFIKDEWFVTGESAYMDEEGYFWLQERNTNHKITSKDQVGIYEIENKLLDYPDIVEVGVIRKPDQIHGEIFKAFITLREGLQPSSEVMEDIRSFIEKGLSSKALSLEIEFKEKIPKTRSGKIIRRVLKAWDSNVPTDDLTIIEE